MRKPEKRILAKDSVYLQYDKGFNHCWYEWEKYHDEEISAIDHWGEEWKKSYDKVLKKLNNLPTTKELIETIMTETNLSYPIDDINIIAKAIHNGR